jgi:hypothetical protein
MGLNQNLLAQILTNVDLQSKGQEVGNGVLARLP